MRKEILEMLSPGLTLIAGPPGVGKSRLCHELAAADIEAGISVIYFSTEEPIESLRHEFILKVPAGANAQDRIKMFDAASNDLFDTQEDRSGGIITSDPDNIFAVAMATMEKLRKVGAEKVSLYLDSASRLFLNYRQEQVLAFVAKFGKELERRGIAGVITIAPILDAGRMVALETYSVGKISLEFDESVDRRKFRAEFLKSGSPRRDWRNYLIAGREAGEMGR